MAMSLAGKTAIVTGAGSGINLSFARTLLNKGCNVLFADLTLTPEAEELVAKHTNLSKFEARAVFQQTDVRDWQQLERMFRVVSEEFGALDIVCPGAGVFEPPGSSFWHPPGTPSSTDPSTSNQYAALDINLTHPIRTTQLALAHFLSTRSDSHPNHPPPKAIIHISSIAAQTTPLIAPIYTVTKHGINALVRSLAPLDKRLGIRVTAVAPGIVKTPIWTDHPDKLRLIAPDYQWVMPEFVAEVMSSLIEQAVVDVDAGATGSAGGTRSVAVEGGMILEVTDRKVRVVEPFNDPGPRAEAATVGNGAVAEEEIFERLGSGEWGFGRGEV